MVEVFDYTVCGLGVQSQVPLPTLLEGARQTDFMIRLGTVDRTIDTAAHVQELLLRANPQEVCFHWSRVGTCVVRKGNEIIVEPEPEVTPGLLCHFLLGVPLAMLLHQRGILVLHASAVAIDDEVVAFVGDSGQGKSTTTGALHKRGHDLITDDILAVDLTTEQAIALPSYPQMRLLPESAVSLGNNPEALPRIFPEGEKRSRLLSEGFCNVPLPLKQIYVLAYGEKRQVLPLTPQQAFLEVATQSYPYQNILKATNTATAKFQRITALVNQVPVCRLERPRDLEALPALVQFIENHVA